MNELKGSGDVIGLLQWVWVVPLASEPRRFDIMVPFDT